VVLFVLVLVPLYLVWFRRFEWVSSRISLRETWIDVLCVFGIDLVPSNAGKPLRFKDSRSELWFLVVFKGSAIPDDLGS
jgi:hypothetical protein